MVPGHIPHVRQRGRTGPSVGVWRVCALALAIACFSLTASAETLEQAWDAALAASPRLDAAQRLSQSAAASLAAARGARLPRLSLESGYTVLDNEPAAKLNLPLVPASQFPLAERNSLSYQAAVHLPLYTGGRIDGGIEAAQAGIEARQAEEGRTASDLKLDVAGAYIGVLRARRSLGVAERNVTSLAAHAADVQRRFGKGLVARNQLLAAQVAHADARQRESQARNALDLARAAYNRLLGRDLSAAVTLEEFEPHRYTDSIEALTARALAQRLELRALDAQINAIKHRASAQRAGAAPQVQLSVGQRYQENRYQVHERENFAMLGLNWDLFDGGIARHQAASTVQQAAAVAAERDELRSRIQLQVRQAWLNERETRQRMAVTREALTQAEEGLRVARSRYREGLGTNTEVLDAETQRTLSYNNHDNAIYDAIFAGLRLRHALGEL